LGKRQVDVEAKGRAESIVLIPKDRWRDTSVDLLVHRLILGRTKPPVHAHGAVPQRVVHSLSGPIEPVPSIPAAVRRSRGLLRLQSRLIRLRSRFLRGLWSCGTLRWLILTLRWLILTLRWLILTLRWLILTLRWLIPTWRWLVLSGRGLVLRLRG